MSGFVGIVVVFMVLLCVNVLSMVSACRVCWTELQLEHQSLDRMLESAHKQFHGCEDN